MAELIIMVGVSASGKSHIAEDLRQEKNGEIVSSDKIREELSFYEDQSRNAEVFKIFHKRIEDGLKAGKTMIADATNITMKSRRPLIDIAKRAHAYVSVCLVIKPFEKCVSDDLNREHSVGRDIIKKQINRFQMPFYEEGIDTIEIYRDKSCGLIGIFKTSYEEKSKTFSQKSQYHKETLFEHNKLVHEAFDKHMLNDDFLDYKLGVELHDCGKLHTLSVDDVGNRHFYNHDNVGVYIFLCNSFGLNFNRIYKTAFLINYHMKPFNWNTEKAIKKVINTYGQFNYDLLCYFNECDKKGCVR